MECVRNSDGGLMILGEDGVALAELSAAAGADPAGFEGLAQRISALLGPALPRVVVTYREGLIEAAQADTPCEVVLIEEDRFDDPPIRVRRRSLPDGDPAAVDAALARAGAPG